MELWSQVIVEWVNCLDVSDIQIKNIGQVRSEKCYEKLIYLLSWKAKELSSIEDIVTEFIKDEYPEFMMEDKEMKTDSNDIYIGSLLLLYMSQELSFQKPMCAKLHHDTQIKIKTFLELLLPYGKNITREILCEAVTELGDSTPKTPLTTQRMQLLKEFFNSPAARSAHSHRKTTEHNRELRRLRIELETERFEKVDLQEDIEIQQKKIQSLEKKLQEKIAEIKLLQEEHLRPATPQSCKKNKNMNQYEILCRKEVDRLEHELLHQQIQMNKVEEEKDSVLKKLTTLEQQCVALKEKCTNFESSVESLLIQIEFRDRELIDLKMTNEELRTHLDELKRKSVADQSYEGDSLLTPQSPKTAEILSSVVDLQLQEVKKESDQLKAHSEAINKKLKCVVEENNRLEEANNVLHGEVQALLPYIEENSRLKEIAMQKSILEQEVVKLQNTIITNSTFLSSLSVSLENFDTEVHTKMNHVFNKLNKSTQCIGKLEESKIQLQTYYESKINLLHSDAYSLKLEKEKLSRDLHNMRESYELLQAKCEDMSIQIKSKDEEMKELFPKVNSLEDEILRYTVDQQQTKKEFDGLKVLLESKNKALKYTNEENNRLKEANNVLQGDCQNLAQYKEENAHLKEVVLQNNVLEQDIIKLQHTILTKDKLLSLLKASLESFEADIHTKMVHILKKLDMSTQRIKELEDSKDKLQQYYESRISILTADTQHTKLEQTKLLQNVNDSYELLREDTKNMSIQMKCKDEEIETLHSKVKTLEDEILKSGIDQQQTKKEYDRLKVLLESANEALKYTNDENNRLTEANSVLQHDCRNMSQYKEENARLNEIALQNNVLEQDIIKLQNTILAKDKFLSLLKASLESFEADIHTKMHHISKKLEMSTKRIIELEDSKNKLQQYYESRISVLNNDTENAKLEQTKLLLDLQKMNNSHRLLQDEAKNMSFQITCKDDEMAALHSEVKTLEDEILKSVVDLHEAKKESDALKEQVKSLNEKLMCTNEDNGRFQESINVLQNEVQKMTKYQEENALLREVNVQKCNLEKDIVKLQDMIMTKDKCLSTLSLSLKTFEGNIHTKMERVSDKLDKAAQRVKDLEDTNNKLKKYYEPRISQANSDMQDLKSERDKLLVDLQEMTNDYKLLREEMKNMSMEIESKDEEIRALCSEIKCLKIECDHLSSSSKEHEVLKCLKERLESQLCDQQRLLDQANKDIQLKQNALEVLHSEMEQVRSENSAFKKKNLIDSEFKNQVLISEGIVKRDKELNISTGASMRCEITSKSEKVKQISENELRLQSQVDDLLKEKRELKEKLDKNRARSAKLEINLAELRNERMKTTQESTSLSSDVENLKLEVARLNEERVVLSQRIEDLSKRSNEEDFADRLKDVHETYKEKLDEIKKKMKLAYNEQVTKMNKTHALAIQKNVDDLRLQMEQTCRKHTEEISKYKAHVGELNKQFWHAAEKLLTEQQQKQEALQQLNELKVKFYGLQLDITQTQSAVSKQQKCFKLEKTDFLSDDAFLENIRTIKVTQEEIHERRHSMRSIQTIGNAFKTADEEGEVFDNTYLTDMKEGYCLPAHDVDRLSVLQQRNSLYLPHLKSSYPAEMQFYPANFNEEEIKTGSLADEMFNDSLSQSLLPEQKTKKKDRSQISYKKPGPPTPSKNGRRLSLQGSGHRSPAFRTLRERNSDRRTTTTPRVFKQMFNIKRQDENVPGTPKRRISNIFRKARVTERQQKL